MEALFASQPGQPSSQNSQSIDQTKESLARVREELQSIASDVENHFVSNAQAALEQAETHNQTDLKRYKRKFQTLKNTFINQDVKQRFIQGLDVPDVRADQQHAILQQLETSLEQQSASLRQLKQHNGALQAQVTETVKKICSTVEEYQALSQALAKKIDDTLDQAAEHDASKPSMPSPLPPGPSEEACSQQLQQEMADTKELESKIAAFESQKVDLEASLKLDGAKVSALQLELQRLEAAASDRAKEAGAHEQYQQAASWCTSMSGMLAALGNISLQHVDQDMLSLELVVSVPLGSRHQATAAMGADAAATPAVRSISHELSFFFHPGTTDISNARLVPSSVAIDDIVEAASEGPAGIKFVVREVRARLRQHWQRKLLLDEVAAQYLLQAAAAGEPIVHVTLPSKTELEVLVPWGWPGSEPQLQLLQLRPSSSSSEAEALCSSVRTRQDLPMGDLLELVKAVEAAGL